MKNQQKPNLIRTMMFLWLTIVMMPACTGCQTITRSLFSSSVNPGINDHYKNIPDVQTWVNRFEVESREIYRERMKIMEALELTNGMRVADVGAGTGLFTGLLANQVGTTGKVYAVDITPEFIKHIIMQVKENNLSNVRTVLCKEKSVELPPASVDMVFTCDTYHHFEYPRDTMRSIYQALKPGGTLIVIDFDRIPHVSREWLLGHVRAGRDQVTSEIASYGFTFDKDIEVGDFLKENYMLRFHKPE